MNMRIPSAEPTPEQRLAEGTARAEQASTTEPTPEQRLTGAVDQAEEAFARALLKLFEYHASQGRTDESLQAAARLVSGPPDPSERAGRYLSLGWSAEDAGRFDLAAKLYARGVELEPTSWFTWYWLTYNLGWSLNELGRFAEAEPWCRAAIRCEPRIPEGYENLGLSLQGQGRFGEAAEAFLAAISWDFLGRQAFDRLQALATEHRGAVAAKIPDIDVVMAHLRLSHDARATGERERAAAKTKRWSQRKKARRQQIANAERGEGASDNKEDETRGKAN